MNRVQAFVDELATLRCENVFNPYADVCPNHDYPDAAAIRRRNLASVIAAALANGTKRIWMGRDLGYRGGRRTGLALTDEVHLDILRARFPGADVQQATVTGPMAERTAREIWRMVRCLPTPPFLWNVFPFHPHEPSDPMTNRRHTAREAHLAEDILDTLLQWFQPEYVVGLGNDANRVLSRLGWNCVHVRHPSYGGQAAFIATLRTLYGLSPDSSRVRLP
jgi:hypothetical protein